MKSCILSSPLVVFLVLASALCHAENNFNDEIGVFSSMGYSNSLNLNFYLVREDNLSELINSNRSSKAFRQPTLSELRKNKGLLYLVAYVDNNDNKRAWGSGSVVISGCLNEREIPVSFVSIPSNKKSIISVVPLGMPVLPSSEGTPKFTWKWSNLSAK